MMVAFVAGLVLFLLLLLLPWYVYRTARHAEAIRREVAAIRRTLDEAAADLAKLADETEKSLRHP